MKNPFKKKENNEHIHCLICSKPLDTSNWITEAPKQYICEYCVQSFSSEYILHRLECDKNGIYKKEFDILEHRLTFGNKMPISIELEDGPVWNYSE